jgi:peptidoglycan/LPS O-acetylase OafA/YrhL
VRVVGEYGWLGVEAFFVISGFVIPYSLYKRKYEAKQCLTFLKERLKRLHPPYLASICIAILLFQAHAAIPGLEPLPIHWSWNHLVAHFVYLNGLLDLRWMIPVFWTLGIEFQFYIFMSLFFPALKHDRMAIRAMAPIVIASLAFIPSSAVDEFGNPQLLTCWMPIFAIGILAFQYQASLIGSRLFASQVLVCVIISMLAIDYLPTLVAVVTAFAILAAGSRTSEYWKPLGFFGAISYSLYLLHLPVGQRVFGVFRRFPETPTMGYLAILCAMAFSLAFAYVLWLHIELPAQRWARRARRLGEPNTGCYEEGGRTASKGSFSKKG